MLAELLAEIEDDRLTSAFYLASTTGWLYRQIAELPAVTALRDLAMNDPAARTALASRAIELFDAPSEPGYRSDHETPICCYAYVLAQLHDDKARETLAYLATNVGAAHGWLLLLMPLYVRDSARAADQAAVAAV
jgi:hypothetical protein